MANTHSFHCVRWFSQIWQYLAEQFSGRVGRRYNFSWNEWNHIQIQCFLSKKHAVSHVLRITTGCNEMIYVNLIHRIFMSNPASWHIIKDVRSCRPISYETLIANYYYIELHFKPLKSNTECLFSWYWRLYCDLPIGIYIFICWCSGSPYIYQIVLVHRRKGCALDSHRNLGLSLYAQYIVLVIRHVIF